MIDVRTVIKMMEAIFVLESCNRGRHIYKTVWTHGIGETTFHKSMNPYDHRAVCIKKDGNIVGHVPQHISSVFFPPFFHKEVNHRVTEDMLVQIDLLLIKKIRNWLII